MATLILTAVGTAIGGPLGGSIGALLGQQIDKAVIGSPRREGPRLKELQITTSSYGQPIPWHFGAMRTAGTVIWSTDLKEQSETSGGGKGRPKTTTFSYSVSFAVALASRPIDGVGRIWADGNLLRGAAGDLKTGGSFRIHNGWGDQDPDPLIASAEGVQSPAFRNMAYAVFEDLQLADFGNRIPALTFEIFAGDGEATLQTIAAGFDSHIATSVSLAGVAGFSWEGGSLQEILASIDQVRPLAVDGRLRDLAIQLLADPATPVPPLPEATVAWEDGDFGQLAGRNRRRTTAPVPRPAVLRHYDPARDYQPGTQRAIGRADSALDQTIEFPGALSASSARSMIEAAAARSARRRETLSWRTSELDPAMRPGTVVKAPGIAGEWRIVSTEWRDRGIEFELVRHGIGPAGSSIADAGRSWSAPDLQLTPTLLRAFELPPESLAQANAPAVYIAATSSGAGWPGAALYADRAGLLEPLDAFSRQRATSGTLQSALAPSACIRFESGAAAIIELASGDFELASTDIEGLSFGRNRMLVGSEVLQFAQADKIGESLWRISGLLRGRGGTENAAFSGHVIGSAATLIDNSLVPLDAAELTNSSRLAAIGHADDQPAYADIENRALASRPLSPVHPYRAVDSNGGLVLRWARRARGAWTWPDEVEIPLVEDRETYRVGLGPVNQPFAMWEVSAPQLAISSAQVAQFSSSFPGAPIWVAQIGTHAVSLPLLLGNLA